MAQAHFVKKARKNYREEDIKKGESYYWWKFPYGGKIKSKTQPKPSQLTQSEYMGSLFSLQEEVDEHPGDETLKDSVDDWVSTLRELGESCREKYDNMPEGLQQGDTGQLLETRADSCESVADEIEGIDMDDPEGDMSTEGEDLYWRGKRDEIASALDGVET